MRDQRLPETTEETAADTPEQCSEWSESPTFRLLLDGNNALPQSTETLA